jgi:hypothetical protein
VKPHTNWTVFAPEASRFDSEPGRVRVVTLPLFAGVVFTTVPFSERVIEPASTGMAPSVRSTTRSLSAITNWSFTAGRTREV